ncbi:PAS domain-containing protein [Sphingomonas koreensis]|nr:PAS domain-containing protein [Sphingomonas koreensis]
MWECAKSPLFFRRREALNPRMQQPTTRSPPSASSRLEQVRNELGSLGVAAETTRLATAFTDGMAAGNPIVLANEAFLALTGFSRDQIIGKPLDYFLAAATDATTVSLIHAALDKSASGFWEVQCRRTDGSEFLAAVFLTPVPGADGAVLQQALSVIELGGHVERLLDQRNEMYAVYEQAPGFIATSQGSDHRFTFANASYKRFVCRDDLVGLTVAEVLPEIADQGFIALLDNVYRTGEPYVGKNMPMTIVDPVDGERLTRYCDFVYQAVRDAKGCITGLFCEGYDVTEQRKTAEALAALQSDLIHVSRVNAMGTMATTLAHELNQPLSAIANYAAGALRMIDTVPGDTIRLAEALQGIDEASQRAAEIIRNLRELTRRREPARGTFDLATAIGECVRLVRATASPGIAIIEEVPPGLAIAADRVQIQQVVINLLRNACDAVAESALQQVSVSARDQGRDLVVSVTDSGPGVSREAAQNIFSWADSSKEGGMGLGLSISQTIMEAHRGRIWLDHSSAAGSRFCFCVPTFQPPRPAETVPPS